MEMHQWRKSFPYFSTTPVRCDVNPSETQKAVEAVGRYRTMTSSTEVLLNGINTLQLAITMPSLSVDTSTMQSLLPWFELLGHITRPSNLCVRPNNLTATENLAAIIERLYRSWKQSVRSFWHYERGYLDNNPPGGTKSCHTIFVDNNVLNLGGENNELRIIAYNMASSEISAHEAEDTLPKRVCVVRAEAPNTADYTSVLEYAVVCYLDIAARTRAEKMGISINGPVMHPRTEVRDGIGKLKYVKFFSGNDVTPCPICGGEPDRTNSFMMLTW